MPKCKACDGRGSFLSLGGPEPLRPCDVCRGTGRRRWREVAAEMQAQRDQASIDLSACQARLAEDDEWRRRREEMLGAVQRERDEARAVCELKSDFLSSVMRQRAELLQALRIMRRCEPTLAEQTAARQAADDLLARYDGGAGEVVVR